MCQYSVPRMYVFKNKRKNMYFICVCCILIYLFCTNMHLTSIFVCIPSWRYLPGHTWKYITHNIPCTCIYSLAYIVFLVYKETICASEFVHLQCIGTESQCPISIRIYLLQTIFIYVCALNLQDVWMCSCCSLLCSTWSLFQCWSYMIYSYLMQNIVMIVWHL